MFSGGIDVKAATEGRMRDLRGPRSSMIPEPARRTNPIRKVGDQIEDVLRTSAAGDGFGPTEKRRSRALEQVKIRPPARALHAYPFEPRAACASASSSHSRSPAIRSC